MKRQKMTHIEVARVIHGDGSCTDRPVILSWQEDRIEGIRLPDEWRANFGDNEELLCFDDLTALPGLIDSHVHLRGLPITTLYPEFKGTRFETKVEKTALDMTIPEGLHLLAGVRNARTALSAGITTVRDCGAMGDMPFLLKQGIGIGLVDGPRTLISGPIITMTGGHGYYSGGEADGPHETRKLTRHLMKKGVDFIKIAGTGGLASATTNPGHRGFSVAEMQAIVEEAHRGGLKVTAHVLASSGVAPVLEAGLDMIEHCWFLEPDGSTNYDPDLVDRMVDAHVVCCPTPATEYRLAEMIRKKMDEGTATREEVELAAWSEAVVDKNIQNVMRMVEQGVTIIHGTDAGVSYIPFDDYALGLELLVNEGGMNPRDAIVSATGEAAKAHGIEAGLLKPGRLADICLVAGNPHDDISALREVRRVYRDGVLAFATSSSE